MSEPSLWVTVVLAALLTGSLLGFLVAQVRAGHRIQQLRVDLEATRVRLESETRLEAERIALLEESEERLRSAFDSLAGQTLRDNSEMFLRMAREALGRDQVVAQASLRERETAIAQLVEPLRAALEKTEAQVQALERERRDAFSSLRTQIETLTAGQSLLQRETRNLVTALRRPEVRGRWGELTLRRIVELAGMSAHCDFTEQLHVASDEGALRPDLVVHMPDARDLVVDVKTPLDAYLEALEATTEEGRLFQLKRHAQHVETRVRQLASKNYWAQFERSPEFAVLFLPGDQFLAAALAERTDLLETALKQNVIIATPSTLIALLKTVAYGWRQSAVAHNAAVIRELGQELYRRLGNFTGHLGRAGARLGAAVEAYNAAVGSLERQVLPQARRFTELGVTADSPIAALDSVDSLARVPTATPAADDAVVSEPDVEGAVTRQANGASNATTDGNPNAPARATTSGTDAYSTASGQSDARNT
jgi:DNA recombination protein RmuC